jgi:hypothetical protein
MKVNRTVKIFFSINWIIGILVLITLKKLEFFCEEFAILIFIIQFIFNLISIIFLVILLLVFKENRIEFSRSILLLFFNFPFLIVYIIMLNEIIQNLFL